MNTSTQRAFTTDILTRAADQFTDAELLASLWETAGVNSPLETALDTLHRTPLARLSQMHGAELLDHMGHDVHRARVLETALALGMRAMRQDFVRGQRIATPADAAAVFATQLAHLPREQMHMLCLDVKNAVVGQHLVNEGWQEGTHVDHRAIFRLALADRATSILLVHNHPSGDPVPSRADRELTRRLIAAGDILGIRVLDHVVVARGGHASCFAEGA